MEDFEIQLKAANERIVHLQNLNNHLVEAFDTLKTRVFFSVKPLIQSLRKQIKQKEDECQKIQSESSEKLDQLKKVHESFLNTLQLEYKKVQQAYAESQQQQKDQEKSFNDQLTELKKEMKFLITKQLKKKKIEQKENNFFDFEKSPVTSKYVSPIKHRRSPFSQTLLINK